MWIQHPTGFYSAVQHRDDRALLAVRARHFGDAQALCAWLDAHSETEHSVVAYRRSDYPYRVFVSKELYGRFLTHLVTEDIPYGNFKDEVTRRQGYARHDVYARVWGALLALTDLPGGVAPADVQAAITADRP